MDKTIEMNETLIQKMFAYYSGDSARIQHYTKVYTYASMIGHAEHLSDELQHILETAAILHDIGIKIAEEKYHSSAGVLQEKEGPAAARQMLTECGSYSDAVIDRVCYLIGHHHTYNNIDGLDYQILVEADFLVNYFENNLSTETIQKSVEKIFRTETGHRIAEEMFYPKEFEMSETWAQDNIQELDDFIEDQGIYIRQ